MIRNLLGISGGKDSAALAIYMKTKYPDMNLEFYEQCIYSDDYGYNISVMWFGK